MSSRIVVDEIQGKTTTAEVKIPGHICQVVTGTKKTETTITGQDTEYHNFQVAFTPKYSDSTLVIMATANGIDTNSNNGRFLTRIREETTSGGITGTILGRTTAAQDSGGTNGIASASLTVVKDTAGSGQRYYKMTHLKGDAGGTNYVQRYGAVQSSIVVFEVCA